MKILESLAWRYATKKFDASKKVSEGDLDKLKSAIQLSASSYGLQAYKVLIVENTEIREQLKPVSWGQAQITDASHLLVFCNHATVGEVEVVDYLQRKADSVGLKLEDLKGYQDFMVSKIGEKSLEEQNTWAAKQTYIALGTLLAACGELKIDACPMEGIEVADYNKILNLEAQGLSTAMVAAIGYRAVDDETQHAPKVRKSKEAIFQVV